MSSTGHIEKTFRFVAILATFLGVAAFAPRASLRAAETEPSVSIRIENPTVFLGESALMIVSVSDYEREPELDLSPLANNFDAVKLGATQRSSLRSTGFSGSGVNFQREYSLDFQVKLTPKKEGTLTVPSPVVNVDGKRLVGDSTELVVKGDSQTDWVLLETVVDPPEATYPLVPITISVAVYFKEAAGKYKQYDPLSLCNTPTLAIPWLDSAAFAETFIPDASLEEWLASLRGREYGFSLNNYRADPFDDFFGSSMLFGSRQTYFLPKPERVQRKNANGEDVNYWKYEFKRRARPSKATTFTLQPVTLKGSYYDFTDPERPLATPFFIRSEPLVVKAQEIPSDAPANYIGVYGVVSQNLDVSTTALSVGEAATLTLEYRGYGSFDAAKAPDLNAIPGVAEAFKTYPPTERSLEDGVAFEYKIRPIKPGDAVFPKVETSFFNVEKGEFQPLSSDEIPFKVSGIAPVQTEKKEVAKASASPNPQDDENNPPLLSKRALKNALLGSGGLLALVALTFACRYGARVHKARIEASDRRFANDAREKLSRGLALFASSPNDGIAAIRIAFLQLVGKKFHQRVDSITDAELGAFFTKEFDSKVDADSAKTVAQLRDFFKYLERYRFAGGAFENDGFQPEAQTLHEKWILLLKKKMKKLSNCAVVFQKSEK